MKSLGIFKYIFFVALFAVGGFFVSAHATKAAAPEAGIYNAHGELLKGFPDVEPFSSVAVGDINKDGKNEIVIGSAPGSAPSITAYTLSGGKIWKTEPYGTDMKSGLNIAVGDLTGYGNVEVISVPRRGAGAQVMRFDGETGRQLAPGFFAFSPKFHGGANLAVGDVNGDGTNEIIIGAGPGSSHVTYFQADGTRIGNLFPFGRDVNGLPQPWGAVVGAIDIDHDGRDEVVVGPQSQHIAEIKIFSWKEEQGSFNAYGKFEGGVSLSTNNSGGGARVLLGAGFGGGPHVLQYDLYTKKISGVNTFPFPDSWRNGVTVAFIQYTDQVEFFAIPGAAFRPPEEKKIDLPGKVIIVDLSEQRLYAYENGVQVNTYLVSTGVPGMDTHIGTFHIYQKQYSKLYSGPGFYLPNTLFNMRYDGPRFLHGAYWHNNFGHPMSHGCVNISYPNAEWLYNWAPMGTTVIVQK